MPPVDEDESKEGRQFQEWPEQERGVEVKSKGWGGGCSGRGGRVLRSREGRRFFHETVEVASLVGRVEIQDSPLRLP